MSGKGGEYWLVLLLSAAGHLVLLAVVLVLGNVSFTRPAPVPLTIQAEVVIDNSAELRRAAEERQRQEQAAAERRRADEQRRQQEQRAAEERRRQQAEQQQQREREATERRAAEERQRQQEAERRAAEERQRQQETERRAAEERQAREAQARREAELAAQLREEEARSAARGSAEMGVYIAQITNRIERNWIKPPSARPGLRCQVRVTQIPGGEVVDVRIGTCNGDDAVQRSIENAVRRASPLPVPDNPRLFERNLVITFEPRD